VIPLAALLDERGVEGPERPRVLAAMAEAPLSGVIEATDAQVARELLDRHLALRCDQPECAAPHAVTIEVPRARCEACGGSDLDRDAARVRDACAAAGVRSILIVGGSPTYRVVLERIFPAGGRPKVRLVPGDRPRTTDKARADLAANDRVVVWGGTILNHATSAPYRGANVITLSHRGLSGMLRQLAERLGSKG
jgi:hypothetical protein